MNQDIVGPAHQQEKDSPIFRNAAIELLRNTVGVSQPLPALSVYISGADPGSAGYYTFNAVASGGNGTYQYRWYSSGDGYNYTDTGVTSSGYTAYFYAGLTWIRVVVTSAGMQASADRQVNVSCGPRNCY